MIFLNNLINYNGSLFPTLHFSDTKKSYKIIFLKNTKLIITLIEDNIKKIVLKYQIEKLILYFSYSHLTIGVSYTC